MKPGVAISRHRRFVLEGALIAVCACRSGGAGGPAAAVPIAGPYDVVIEGGRVVDGTGGAWFYGDVALRGDRIARVAPAGGLSHVAARERLDAHGLVVAPGFIDIQGQSQAALLAGDGRLVSKVTQGVTTEILGEGVTRAPVNDRILDATYAGTPDQADARRRAAEFRGPHGFDAWLRAMERHGMSVNVGSFVGGATVRMYAKGMAVGPPTPANPNAAVLAALKYVGRTSCCIAFAPVEDLVASVEQPNLPGTIDEHPNWRRRVKKGDLFRDDAARARMRAFVQARRK